MHALLAHAEAEGLAPNVHCFNVLLWQLTLEGRPSEAFEEVLSEMSERAVAPDEVRRPLLTVKECTYSPVRRPQCGGLRSAAQPEKGIRSHVCHARNLGQEAPSMSRANTHSASPCQLRTSESASCCEQAPLAVSAAVAIR